MEITWLGADALLLRGRETRVLVAPPGTDGSSSGRSGFDILVGGAASDNVLRPESGPQVLVRPGEYEVRGVSVRGVAVPSGTVFVTEVDEVSVCNLGELPTELSDEAVETIGVVDVVAVSLQRGLPARALAVAQLATRLQPAVLIPVGYEVEADGSSSQLAAFVKEMGLAQVSPQAKLTLSGSSGSVDDTRVVVLEPRS